jgi:hypothetical protein
MNTDQFRAMLDLGRDGDGGTLGVRPAMVCQDTQHAGERSVVADGLLVASFAQESVIRPFA